MPIPLMCAIEPPCDADRGKEGVYEFKHSCCIPLAEIRVESLYTLCGRDGGMMEEEH